MIHERDHAGETFPVRTALFMGTRRSPDSSTGPHASSALDPSPKWSPKGVRGPGFIATWRKRRRRAWAHQRVHAWRRPTDRLLPARAPAHEKDYLRSGPGMARAGRRRCPRDSSIAWPLDLSARAEGARACRTATDERPHPPGRRTKGRRIRARRLQTSDLRIAAGAHDGGGARVICAATQSGGGLSCPLLPAALPTHARGHWRLTASGGERRRRFTCPPATRRPSGVIAREENAFAIGEATPQRQAAAAKQP